jgi:hypothetical protein
MGVYANKYFNQVCIVLNLPQVCMLGHWESLLVRSVVSVDCAKDLSRVQTLSRQAALNERRTSVCTVYHVVRLSSLGGMVEVVRPNIDLATLLIINALQLRWLIVTSTLQRVQWLNTPCYTLCT